jgi:rhodanese-related sulfurtransferase
VHHPPQVPEITATELKERLDNGQPIILVDVRHPKEYAIADLAEYDPVRIPVDQFVARMDELDQDENVVVYCRSGARSEWAVRHLMAAGHTKALNLDGGILAWREQVDPNMTAY